jgi:hypothetical protein
MRRRQLNTWVQVNLRIQEAQRRKLEAAAKANQVSFNDEVRRRLTESFQRESLDSFLYKLGMVGAEPTGALLKKISVEAAPIETILGSGLKEAPEAKAETQAPQQERKKGGKS